MLFMVTSRRIQGGRYGDDEQANYRFDYLYDYDDGPRRGDGFKGNGKAGFDAAVLAELKRLRSTGVNTPKIGIYLHGYNNDWHDSIDEIVDLRDAMQNLMPYEPIIVGFSWPSSGKTKKYLSDREEVRDSVPAFVRFLRDINDFLTKHERDCVSTTYCIAHSMGNYLLRKGMEYLSDHIGTPVGRLMFNETVMLAPDLAASDIEHGGKGQYIAQFSRRVHVYYSKHDRALKASSVKRFGGNRLGRHGAEDYGNLPGNVVVVDAAAYANSTSTNGLMDRGGNQVSVHSSHRYHDNILADVQHVLSSVDRSLIPNRAPVADDERPPGAAPNHYRLT